MESVIPPEELQFRLDSASGRGSLDGVDSPVLTRSHGDNRQRWQFVDAGNGSVTIHNVKTQRVLAADAKGRVTTEAPAEGSHAQRWRVEHAGGGHGRIVNLATGTVLDGEGGSVHARPWRGVPDQQWALEPDLDPAIPSVANTCCGYVPSSRKRFNDPRHQKLVAASSALLREVGPPRVVTTFEGWFRHERFQEALAKGLLDADYVAPYVGDLYDSHFYDPDTGLNYRQKADPTALTEATRYLYKSATLRQQVEARGPLPNPTDDERHQIGYDLGLALHYVTDLIQPMHAANFINYAASLFDKRHQGFEDYADTNLDRFHADRATYVKLRPILLHDLPGGVVHTLARHAKRVYAEKVAPELRLKVGSGLNLFGTGTLNRWGSEADPALEAALPFGEVAVTLFLWHWCVADPRSTVDRIYRQFLKREPTPVEREFCVDAITNKAWSARRVIEAVAGSDEYYAKFASKAKTLLELARLMKKDFHAHTLTQAEESMLEGATKGFTLPTMPPWPAVVKGLLDDLEYRDRFGDYRVPNEAYPPVFGTGWTRLPGLADV